MLDPDGLFARRLPIGLSCFSHLAIVGFCQRRFDLFAIVRLALQSWSVGSFTIDSEGFYALCMLRSPVWFIIGAVPHHGPRDARRLVGHRHRRYISTLLLKS
jgi:hypothetical protein